MSKSLGLSVLIALLGLLVGCSSGMESSARSRYNHGNDMLAKGDLASAERAFMEARNDARGDQQLRYAAAFNLGMLHARKAEETSEEELQEALAELQKARSWFQDAAKVRSDDKDARINLEIVGHRAQILADQLNKGKNSLDARLNRVIEDERALRDQVRQLMEVVKASGAEADPVGFQEMFASLATQERVLLAEAGTISDLASDELALLDGQPEEQMEQQDKVRQMQLRALDAYLQSGRVAIDDARRSLRKLDGKRSHADATRALAHLKRAREQLADPVTTLKAIAGDQQQLFSHTLERSRLGNNEVNIDAPAGAVQQAPPWLNPEHLADRQGDVYDRTAEVLARFQAAKDTPPPEDPSSVDPKAARTLEMAALALPFLEGAVAAMSRARDELAKDGLLEAQEQEIEALRNLMRAIEHFSDLRNLIELTYAEQVGVVAILDPETAASDPELAKLPTLKRAQKSQEATERNIQRLVRMAALIAEELEQAKAQAAQQAEQAGGDPPDTSGTEQTFAQAEQLRYAAKLKLTAAEATLRAIAAGTPKKSEEPPLVLATDAQTDLEELRRIFYTIIEHLKELHRDQGETYDQTGTAQAAEDEARALALPPVAEQQAKHAALAEALADALEKQADAAAQSQEDGAAEEAEKFGNAAAEVRLALEAMKAATNTLSKATEDSATMSVDLSPALEDQPIAIEHIAAAIEILEPPQEQPPQEQDQQDQQQQEEEEISKQQAERRLQEVRDREAQRQRDREKRQAAPGGAVDKDW